MDVRCEIKNRFMESQRCEESWEGEATTDSSLFCAEVSVALRIIRHYFCLDANHFRKASEHTYIHDMAADFILLL